MIEPDAVVAAWARLWLEATAYRPATAADVAASHSTWAKRLGLRPDRAIWLFDLRRV